jgi:hypothetical protein
MKRLAYTALISSVILFALSPVARTQEAQKETAVVQFFDKIEVAKTLLEKGKYVFEHDDGRMARGEPCMYVYSYTDGKADKLLVTFHCKPVERKLATATVTNEEMTKEPGVFRLLEVQFAGSTKGHIVPQG